MVRSQMRRGVHANTVFTHAGWFIGPPDYGHALFGEMVSVPTSGKQIKDERETFKTFLQAINLMPRVAKKEDQANSFSLNTKFKCVHIHLVDGGFDNVGKKGKGKNVKNPRNYSESKARTHKKVSHSFCQDELSLEANCQPWFSQGTNDTKSLENRASLPNKQTNTKLF